jgi:hypothetical protein
MWKVPAMSAQSQNPAAKGPQQLNFEIPASQAAKVIATVTQPAYAGSP